eukprot:scaffold7715_cov210-Pinguiococcus_pyrenoidosus.AAC.1
MEARSRPRFASIAPAERPGFFAVKLGRRRLASSWVSESRASISLCRAMPKVAASASSPRGRVVGRIGRNRRCAALLAVLALLLHFLLSLEPLPLFPFSLEKRPHLGLGRSHSFGLCLFLGAIEALEFPLASAKSILHQLHAGCRGQLRHIRLQPKQVVLASCTKQAYDVAQERRLVVNSLRVAERQQAADVEALCVPQSSVLPGGAAAKRNVVEGGGTGSWGEGEKGRRGEGEKEGAGLDALGKDLGIRCAIHLAYLVERVSHREDDFQNAS